MMFTGTPFRGTGEGSTLTHLRGKGSLASWIAVFCHIGGICLIDFMAKLHGMWESQVETEASFERDCADFSNIIYSGELSTVVLLFSGTSKEQTKVPISISHHR